MIDCRTPTAAKSTARQIALAGMAAAQIAGGDSRITGVMIEKPPRGRPPGHRARPGLAWGLGDRYLHQLCADRASAAAAGHFTVRARHRSATAHGRRTGARGNPGGQKPDPMVHPTAARDCWHAWTCYNHEVPVSAKPRAPHPANGGSAPWWIGVTSGKPWFRRPLTHALPRHAGWSHLSCHRRPLAHICLDLTARRKPCPLPPATRPCRRSGAGFCGMRP